MSSNPSPTPHHRPDHDKDLLKRRDRPPALHFSDNQPPSRTDYHHAHDNVVHQDQVHPPSPSSYSRSFSSFRQPRLHLSRAEDLPIDSDYDIIRSPSATSSLDPYYFSIQTPPQSPIHPPITTALLPKTPDIGLVIDPVTPGKDPASIDRRALVGVGELATPRWTRSERNRQIDIHDQLDEQDEPEPVLDAQLPDDDNDLPDSPWTIEAIDGEQEDDTEVRSTLPSLFYPHPSILIHPSLSHSPSSQQLLEPPQIPRPLRSRRSIADESGGEEILYPRHPMPAEPPLPMLPPYLSSLQQTVFPISASNSSEGGPDMSPPTSFVPPIQRARKRTSEEFELDHSGVLVSKHASAILPISPKEKEKASVRRHRSLGGNAAVARPPERTKDRKKDTLSVNVKHTRQTSASSSSSSHGENIHSRRIHPSDFSHLPPSPSTTSIQQFLKQSTPASTATPQSHRDSHLQHSTPSVAHSLLRGTQEGWSDLDDQATAEALRKLDGLSGRSARARSSVGSHVRVASSSRPVTPVKTDESSPPPTSENRRSSRRFSTFGSLTKRDNDKAKDHQGKDHGSPITIGLGLSLVDPPPPPKDEAGASSGDATSGSPLEKSAKKAARTSFTPKRGSASSTNYTSTPTTSSRDSASLSTATSATSVSAISSRQSTAKGRPTSAGSDMSSFSQDATLRDRTGSLSATGDAPDDANVPPVPPLPKDISSYKPGSQPLGQPVPYISDLAEDRSKMRRSEVPTERNPSLDVRNFPATPSKHHSFSLHKSSATPTTHKTPSKKWSFTNALGKKLSKSPSSSSMNDSSSSKSPGALISPRSLTFGQQLRKSTSKDQPTATPKQSIEDWSPVNVAAMASATSLASQLSINSNLATVAAPAPLPITTSKTPDRLVPSRSETASSASTNLTASMPPLPNNAPLSPSSSIRRGPSTKRLTPSSIPFFRRSSSQSMQFPPSGVLPSSSSPTQSTSTTGGTLLRAPSNFSPTKDTSFSSSSVPGSAHKKSSVLSLGLPSLLKGSSSRRSLHSDKEKSDAKSSKDSSRSKDSDKEKPKKEEKDRSESRISYLMGRKRGKVRSWHSFIPGACCLIVLFSTDSIVRPTEEGGTCGPPTDANGGSSLGHCPARGQLEGNVFFQRALHTFKDGFPCDISDCELDAEAFGFVSPEPESAAHYRWIAECWNTRASTLQGSEGSSTGFATQCCVIIA